ncbi:MAG TPA: hypothetical protein VGM43_26205 [Bryobacteraceae bacterium]
MNVTGPGSSGGLTGLDARALRLLAETLIAETAIEGAASGPQRADDPRAPDPRAPAPADHLTVSFDALTGAPLQHLLQTIEQKLFPLSATLQDVAAPALADAKDAAQKSVDRATQAIEEGGIHGLRIPENLDPQTVLALATRMVETQQYPNYLRAAELSNTIVTWYEGPLPDVPLTRPISTGRTEKIRHARPSTAASTHKWTQTTAKLWRRAPVLVLLVGWLLAGSIVAILSRESSPILTTWALGFPALVSLQFILTIRGVWRRK